MSGQSRMMYQYLAPEPEGAIFCKRSMPQVTYSSPHDTFPVSHTNPSIANWQESNIQGNEGNEGEERSRIWRMRKTRRGRDGLDDGRSRSRPSPVTQPALRRVRGESRPCSREAIPPRLQRSGGLHVSSTRCSRTRQTGSRGGTQDRDRHSRSGRDSGGCRVQRVAGEEPGYRRTEREAAPSLAVVPAW
jgi:hypothetical protein